MNRAIENGTQEPRVFPLSVSQNIAVKTPTLALSVQVSSEKVSQVVNAQYDEVTATWIADAKIQPGKSTEFVLTWSDKVRDQSLTLAQAKKIVSIPLDIKQLNLDIPSNEYKLSFDADADGLSNLTETANSTNPFDSSDPGAGDSVIKVDVNVNLPDDLVDSEKFAAILRAAFLDGAELTLSLKGDVDKNDKPVSDADFEKVLEKFGALSQAIENKDADALDRIATSSKQSDLFKRLMKNDYEQIDVSIENIRLRNIDKSISGTLRIDSLIRANGDRGSLSEKYTSRKITSRRVDGDWSKIEW